MFSKACEYGIRALLYVAVKSHEGERVIISDIAKEIDSPVSFTAKILQQLVKAAVVTSVKGPYGGFEITDEKMKTTTLAHIVEIIDGPAIFCSCGLGLGACEEGTPCPLHFKYHKVRRELKKMLESSTLEKLTQGIERGSTHLKL